MIRMIHFNASFCVMQKSEKILLSKKQFKRHSAYLNVTN